jgi:hypothetical protein
MEFIWDEAKAKRNLEKHGITFAEVTQVFSDPLALTFDDVAHSVDEQRWITFGTINGKRYVVVCHTEADLVIRIISAREMTKSERVLYEQG